MEYRHYVYVPPSNGNACTCITVNSGFQPFVYSEKVFCTCFTQLFQPFLIVAWMHIVVCSTLQVFLMHVWSVPPILFDQLYIQKVYIN